MPEQCRVVSRCACQLWTTTDSSLLGLDGELLEVDCDETKQQLRGKRQRVEDDGELLGRGLERIVVCQRQVRRKNLEDRARLAIAEV
jgi:hypothetical protein